MKRLKFLLLMLFALAGGSLYAQLATGDYYLINVATGKGVNFAKTDGYRAVLADHPHVLTITDNGSTYSIGGHHTKNYLINASGSYASSGAAFTITTVDADHSVYTISKDGGSTFLGYDGNNTEVAMALSDGKSDNAKWYIKSRAQLLSELSAATEDHPIDATFLIYAQGFNRHDGDMTNMWKGDFSSSHTGFCSGMAENQCAFFFNDGTNWKNGVFDAYQTISDAPTGKYLLRCQGFYRYGSNTTGKADYNYETGSSTPGAVLYANGASTPLKSFYSSRITDKTFFTGEPVKLADKYVTSIQYGGTTYYFPYISAGDNTSYQSTALCVAFNHGQYAGNEVEFSLSDATLKIGVKTASNVANEWTGFDNFELYYLGPLQDLTPFKEQYEALRTKIQDYFISQTTVYTDENGAAAAYHSIKETQDAIVEAATSEQEITDARTALWNAALTFMKSVKINPDKGFDLTWMIGDADFSDASYKTYWKENLASSTTVGIVGGDNKILRYYNCSFDLGQTLAYTLPAGAYRMKADGFERTNDPMNTAWSDYQAGNSTVTGAIYLNDNEQLVKNLFDDQSVTTNVYGGEKPSGASFYTPNGSTAASKYLTAGLYQNTLIGVMADDGPVTIGYRCANTKAWTVIDNFQLEYIGEVPKVTLSNQAGEITPVCAPFTLSTEDPDVEELYAIAAVNGDDSKLLLYAVQSLPAGTPGAAKFGVDSYSAPMEMTLTDGKKFVMPWDGSYATTDAQQNTWNYISVWGEEINSQDLQKIVLDYNDMNFDVNLENVAVRRYLSQVGYTGSSDASNVAEYNVAPPARRDIPNAVMIPVPAHEGDAEIIVQNDYYEEVARITVPAGVSEAYVQNLIPQQHYWYQIYLNDFEISGAFHTTGHLRMVYAPSAYNIRDLGGWKAQDGHRTTYGHLFRGSTLNGYVSATPEDIQALKDLGIGGEIDLRYQESYDKDMGCGTSAFGFGSDDYFFAAANDWTAANLNESGTQQRLKQEFDFILNHFRQGKAVYYHCAWGADRTGMLSFLLEGVLGLTIDQIYKDYELTSFSAAPGATNRLKTSFQDRIDVILALDGATLRDKFENYFINKLGVSIADINYFRSVMLEVYPLQIDEDANVPPYFNGQADITLKRTLKAGMHNTIVLPCDLPKWKARYYFGSDVKMEKITAYEGGVLLTEEINEAPANTPFLLIPSEVHADNTYLLDDVSVREGGLTDAEFTNGKLVGSYAAATVVSKSEDADKTNYVISNDRFYFIDSTPATMKGTRAYLVLNNPASGVKSIVTFDGLADGIESPAADELNGSDIYDLSGRRVSNPARGIYIMNGKKVVVR